MALFAAADAAAPIDFTPFEDVYSTWEAQFKSGPGVGEYSYLIGKNTSVYGSADMLMSRFIIGRTDALDERELDEWAATINRFQDAVTGLYVAAPFEPHSKEPAEMDTGDHEHTTAFAVAALALIGRRPTHRLTAMIALQANRSRWEGWLANEPVYHSWDHRSSGVYAALALTGALEPAFSSWYFEWLNAHADPGSGFYCPPTAMAGKKPFAGWMTCYAHVLWQFHYANASFAFPEKMVDATLDMQNASTGWFCRNPGAADPAAGCDVSCTVGPSCGSASPVQPSCHQLDGLWAAARASELAGGYRRSDVREMCDRYLTSSAAVMGNRTAVLGPVLYADSHGLNGAMQSVAECARWFPELLRTRVPWTISLEKAPFM
jgi:hypothetical protein